MGPAIGGRGHLRVVFGPLPLLSPAHCPILVYGFSVTIDVVGCGVIVSSSLGRGGLDDLLETLVKGGIAAVHGISPLSRFEEMRRGVRAGEAGGDRGVMVRISRGLAGFFGQLSATRAMSGPFRKNERSGKVYLRRS